MQVKSNVPHQDTDVIPLVDKYKVVWCFVYWNYNKVFMYTGKFSDNLWVTKNWHVSGVDRVFKSPNSTFQNISDRFINQLGKSVDFDILLLCHRLAYSSKPNKIKWVGASWVLLTTSAPTLLPIQSSFVADLFIVNGENKLSTCSWWWYIKYQLEN